MYHGKAILVKLWSFLGAGFLTLIACAQSTPAAQPAVTQPPASLTNEVTRTPQPPTIRSTATNLPLPTPAATRAVPTRKNTIDDLLASCPSAADIAAINRDLKLVFESDQTGSIFVCRAADGSADLTLLQERTYQALVVMRKLQFDASLPWTNLSLYQWFIQAIDGIRFRDDIDTSYCCDPANTINVKTSNLSALQTERWLDPQLNAGLQGLMVLFVHEARHNEGYYHTCDNSDNTLSEMGAWGVQYYLLGWLGSHSDPDFLTSRDAPTDYYRQAALAEAATTRNSRFCREPTLAPGQPLEFP